MLRVFEPVRPAEGEHRRAVGDGRRAELLYAFRGVACDAGLLRQRRSTTAASARPRHPPLRGFRINIVDWARQDCAAVIDFTKIPAARICRSTGSATASAGR